VHSIHQCIVKPASDGGAASFNGSYAGSWGAGGGVKVVCGGGGGAGTPAPNSGSGGGGSWPDAAEREQAAYRKGWEAGARKVTQGLRIEMVVHDEVKPIDLQRMAYESRASSDRAASKAHAERAYWADGIDPDDV